MHWYGVTALSVETVWRDCWLRWRESGDYFEDCMLKWRLRSTWRLRWRNKYLSVVNKSSGFILLIGIFIIFEWIEKTHFYSGVRMNTQWVQSSVSLRRLVLDAVWRTNLLLWFERKYPIGLIFCFRSIDWYISDINLQLNTDWYNEKYIYASWYIEDSCYIVTDISYSYALKTDVCYLKTIVVDWSYDHTLHEKIVGCRLKPWYDATAS